MKFCRFSPYEKDKVSENESKSRKLMNSLWFGIGALMQQGTEFSPRSISGRFECFLKINI